MRTTEEFEQKFEQEFERKVTSGLDDRSSKEQGKSLHQWTEEQQKKAQIKERLSGCRERKRMEQKDCNSQRRRAWENVWEPRVLVPSPSWDVRLDVELAALVSSVETTCLCLLSTEPLIFRASNAQDLTFKSGLNVADFTHQEFAVPHTGLKPASLWSVWSRLATHECDGKSLAVVCGDSHERSRTVLVHAGFSSLQVHIKERGLVAQATLCLSAFADCDTRDFDGTGVRLYNASAFAEKDTASTQRVAVRTQKQAARAHRQVAQWVSLMMACRSRGCSHGQRAGSDAGFESAARVIRRRH